MAQLCDARAGRLGHHRGMDEHASKLTIRRLTVSVPSVRGFQADYERLVPDAPFKEVGELVARGAPWSDMVKLLDERGPHGFLIYFRNDIHKVMQLAGDATDGVGYLMGNQTTAERMFRHDPRVMLYVPFHTLIWGDSAGRAWFSVDQPGSVFSQFGNPDITAVGIETDRALAKLLDALGVEVPVELTES
jgi:hypothetical protein